MTEAPRTAGTPGANAPGMRDAKVESWPGLAHVIIYGQSLSCGFGGLPPLSTDPEPLGVRFAGGVRPVDDFAAGYGSLMPMAERSSGYFGETPATAAVRMFAQLLAAEDGMTADDAPFRLLMSTPGEPGKSVSDLSVGTGNFDRVKGDILAGFLRAEDRAVAYRLMAMCWVQGETDYERSTPGAEYLAQVRAFHADLRAMARGMDPLAGPFPLLMAQTISHPFVGKTRPDIALAQLEFADDADVAMVCVPYALPFWPNDLHMMAAGYQWLGAYLGLALKRWLWDGIKPRHIRPLAAEREGGAIVVRFDTPGPPLAFDTEMVAAMPAMGFTLADEVGTEVAIADVALAGNDAVRLGIAADAPGGLRVRYGWRGNGALGLGNLRDTAGDLIRFEGDGYSRPLHNWCPILEIEAS